MTPSPSGDAATLQAVASKAGVSISTASRCLSGAANVAKKTQEKVLAAAEELGYRHNRFISEVMRAARRGLTQQYLGTLAFVTPFDESSDWWGTPTLYRQWEGARTRAESLGFNVTEFRIIGNGMTGRRVGEILHARGISGILLGAFPCEPSEIALPWDEFATVPIGHLIRSPHLDCVISDHTEAVITAGRELAKRGFRRVGLAIEEYQDHITNGRWTVGFAGMSAAVPELERVPPYLPAQMEPDGFIAWVEKHDIQAVLTLSTFRNKANPMQEWLSERGHAVPHDVSLATLDITSVHPDWAGIEQHSIEIGRAAVDLLLAKLRAQQRGVPEVPRTMYVHGQWKDGGTVSAKPKGKS
jgi:DNA-binding LacI/PurR family transcriptional regulator